MKTAIKITVALLLVVVLAIGGLTYFAKSYLTDERIRSYIVETAGKSLGREVQLGSIQVSIFSGIRVRDFEIKEKDAKTPFVKADDFVLNYQLLPLLSRSLVIDELKLVNARVVIRKNADGTFNFSDIGGTSRDQGAKETPASGGGLPVSLSARSLSLANVTIDYSEPAGRLTKAALLIDADLGIASTSSDKLSTEGNFRLTIVEAVLKDRAKPIKDLRSKGTFALDMLTSAKKVDIREFSAEVAGLPFTVKGYLSHAEPLSYAVDVNMPETGLAALQQAAGPFLPEGTSLDGAASLALSAEQSAATNNRMTFKGQLVLKNAAIAAKGYRPVLNGTIRFTPEVIGIEKLMLVAGDTSAEMNGQVRDYANAPDVRLDVKAASLNMDAIAVPAGSGTAQGGSGTASKSEEKEFEPLNTKARAEGSIEINSILYHGIKVQDFRTAYTFRDNVFRITSMTGSTLNGSFRLQSTVDLSKRGTTYSMNADTSGMKLEEMTAAFAPKAKDTLFGVLTGKMELSGAGTLPANVKRNLSGKGAFSVKDGKIRNAKVSSGLLAFLGLGDTKEIVMDRAEGTFTIANSVMNLVSLITSRDLILDEKGTIGMDESLDLGVMAKASEKLSPKLLSQSSISQFMSEEKGWTVIPLRIGGTLSNPSYSVDMQYVGKRLQKKAGEEIFKALSGDSGKKSGEEPAKKKKKDAGPEDLLKGFFK